MVCFRKDLKISSFSFPNPITELCKKTENYYRTVARILKLYETMETDAIYQCLNQSRYSTVICGQKCNVRIFCFDECSFCIRQIVRIVDRLRIEPSELVVAISISQKDSEQNFTLPERTIIMERMEVPDCVDLIPAFAIGCIFTGESQSTCNRSTVFERFTEYRYICICIA